MKKLIIAIVLFTIEMTEILPVSAQVCVSDDRFIASVLTLTGAAGIEELEEFELERFQHLADHPIALNRSGRSRLLSCGLFSYYQVATILDYRERNGDILSMNELAVVDGFNRETAYALVPFVVFDSSGAPASRKNNDFSNELTSKSLLKVALSDGKGSEGTLTGAVKYRFSCNDTWTVGLGFTSSLGYCASLAYTSPWRGRKVSLSKVIIGDYSLRFGQGLAMWNGMSLSGLGNVSSYSRNPTGAVQYNSYQSSLTSVHRGVATEVLFGRFTLTTAVASPKGAVLPAMNLSYCGRIHQESLTTYATIGYDGELKDLKIASDFRVNVRGTDVFGEVATNLKSVAFLAGSRMKLNEKLSMAALVRMYPRYYTSTWSGAVRSSTKCSDEHGASLAARFKAGQYTDFKPAHLLDMSIDGAWHPSNGHWQVKAIANYEWTVSSAWTWNARLQYKHRNFQQRDRVEMRNDVKWKSGPWMVSGRVHVLYGDRFGSLGYVEGGYEKKAMSSIALYLRIGAYATSGWNDRIYVYERDSQGNFNVPAFSGQGWWTSLYSSIKVRRWLKLGIRAYTNNGRKYECRLQASFIL